MIFDCRPGGAAGAWGGRREFSPARSARGSVLTEETGDRRQETGDRRQETGDRRQETGDRRRSAVVSAAALGMSDGLGHGECGNGGWRNSDDQELIQRFFLADARIIVGYLNFGG